LAFSGEEEERQREKRVLLVGKMLEALLRGMGWEESDMAIDGLSSSSTMEANMENQNFVSSFSRWLVC
jgi:hypothetical protein